MYIKYLTNWNILSYYDWPLQMRNFLTISATAAVSHILQPVLLEPQAVWHFLQYLLCDVLHLNFVVMTSLSVAVDKISSKYWLDNST